VCGAYFEGMVHEQALLSSGESSGVVQLYLCRVCAIKPTTTVLRPHAATVGLGQAGPLPSMTDHRKAKSI
jgi:hypothetical protein